jgi:hypothetical protein
MKTRSIAEQAVELELEYFELVDTGNEMTLLRLAGRWAGVDPRTLERPSLVLNAGGSLRRLPALPDNGGRAGGPGTLWRAAFGAPTSLAKTGSARYSLDVGLRVDLPRPVPRQLVRRAHHGRPERDAAGSPDTAPPPHGPTVAMLETGAEATPLPRRLRAVPHDEARSDAPPQADPMAAPQQERRAGADRPQRRRRGTVLSILLGAVAGAAVAVAAFGSGGDGGEGGAGARLATVSLQPAVALAGSAARGVVTEDASGHGQLVLRGLPAGRYTVWMFDSILDAQPVGAVTAPGGTVALPDRAELRRHRFLDVSHEDDDNPNHSGQSILRLSIARLP